MTIFLLLIVTTLLWLLLLWEERMCPLLFCFSGYQNRNGTVSTSPCVEQHMLGVGGGARRVGRGSAGQWDDHGFGAPCASHTDILFHGWPYTSLSTVLCPRRYLHSANKTQQDQKGWVSHPKQLCAGVWTRIPVGPAVMQFLWSQCDSQGRGLHGWGDLRTVIETFWASFFVLIYRRKGLDLMSSKTLFSLGFIY